MTEYANRTFSVSQRGRDPKDCTCEWVRIFRDRVECVQCGHTETLADYKLRGETRAHGSCTPSS